jgi:flagellar protein FliL
MAAEIPVLPPAEEGAPAKGKGKGKLLLFIIIGVVALGAIGGGVFWFTHSSAHPAASAAAAPKATAPAGPPLYVALDPPFVVNFDPDQSVRFLQITVQLMSRDPATIELLKANDPQVRNDLLLLFGNQKYAVLATRPGKEALRNDSLAAVQHVISSAGGHPEKLEAVYFTSFVMQ